MLAAYGAYGEKLLYGKLVEGVIRSTFVVDVDAEGAGTVAVAQYNVRAAGHVDKLKREPRGLTTPGSATDWRWVATLERSSPPASLGRRASGGNGDTQDLGSCARRA